MRFCLPALGNFQLSLCVDMLELSCALRDP